LGREGVRADGGRSRILHHLDSISAKCARNKYRRCSQSRPTNLSRPCVSSVCASTFSLVYTRACGVRVSLTLTKKQPKSEEEEDLFFFLLFFSSREKKRRFE